MQVNANTLRPLSCSSSQHTVVKYVIILLGLLFHGIGFGQTERVVQIEKKIGEADSVYHDKLSQTIDFYFTAKYEDQYIWDFNQDNLKIYETIGGNKTELSIYAQARIRDTSHFSEPYVYQVKTRSESNLHQERREYEVVWFYDGSESIQDTVFKSWPALTPFSLVSANNSFWDTFVIGAIILSLLLLVLSELIPFLRRQTFLKNFVHPYHKVQKANEQRLHPVTASPISSDERVVMKCNQPFCGVPFSVWEKKNYQCWYYPNQCQGFANIGFKQFFTQTGIFKKLNWLWFGALGGLLAWAILHLLKNQTLADEKLFPVFMGAALGFSITAMLAWVEEKGQGRELSYARILLKVLLGTIVSALVFYLFTFLPLHPIVTGVNWLLFCITLGLILSINSSISVQRGLISGLIAGGLSALVYVLLIVLIPNPEAEFTILFTFIVAGGILGYVIMQVVSRLERIELEVISPTLRRGSVFPLDRWLNAGRKVTIGRDMKGCEVRVKWEDNYVLPQHVELDMKNNKVFITPLGDAEIWVMDSPLKGGKSHQLEGGEIIRLGRHSQTAFKYMQKS